MACICRRDRACLSRRSNLPTLWHWRMSRRYECRNIVRVALLVMVHGSPRPAANQDVVAVADVIRQRALFELVEVCFMELNEPAIPVAIERCVRGGATRVIGVPYFLHAGNHVISDLVHLMEQAQADYPAVEFLMGDYLGVQSQIDDVIRARIAAALPFTSDR
jgi:sirohydrochlorin ferrochelatase